MKRILLSLTALAAFIGASAISISPAVKIQTDGPAHNPTLSPDGKILLFSSDNHSGLMALNLGGNTITVLDDAPGAGFNPIFSTDGKTVIYQTAKLVDGLLNRDVRSFNLVSGETAVLAPMSRRDVNLSDIAGTSKYVYASLEGIMVVDGKKTAMIRPIADAHSYLWASLSPDGTRIVFVEPFQGVFVCSPDGSNLTKIAAKGAFPAWAGNDKITYTLSHDDGYVILDSTLKVYDMNTGIAVDLTPADVIIGESTSSSDGTVVYSTLEGDIYIMTIK